MKTTFLPVLASLSFFQCTSQKGFEIKGKIDNAVTDEKVYMVYNADTIHIIDSAEINGGNFSFKGNVNEPTDATLILDHQGVGLANLNNQNADFLSLYLEDELIKLSSKDSIKTATITGSAINDQLTGYNNFIRSHTTKSAALQKEIADTPVGKRNDSVFQKTLQKKTAAAHEEGVTALKMFIQQNPTSYFSLVALSNLVQIRADVLSLGSLYKTLSDSLQNTLKGKKTAKEISKLSRLVIGAVAPDFTQPDVAGKSVKLTDFRGKYLLVDFWASWCGPCRAENPNVVKNYAKYHSKGLDILSISVDDSSHKDGWLKVIKDDGLSWAQVSDLKGPQNEAAQLYEINSIPQNYLLNPEGKIIAVNLRGEALGNMLDTLLGAAKPENSNPKSSQYIIK